MSHQGKVNERNGFGGLMNGFRLSGSGAATQTGKKSIKFVNAYPIQLAPKQKDL